MTRPAAHTIDTSESTVADLEAEIHQLLNDLLALLPLVEALTDSRQRGRGFLGYEGRQTLDRQVQAERRDRRAQPVRRDDHGNVLIGLAWLNRTTTAAGTGEIDAPGNFRAIAVEADIHFTLTDVIRRLARRRAVTDLPAWAVLPGTCLPAEPTIRDLAGHLLNLVVRTPSVSALTEVLTAVPALVESADQLVDGNDRELLADLCPHCERRSLVRYLRDGLTRCERDTRSKHYKPCTCPRLICGCKTSPVTFRHEWHDNPKDKTQRSVWDLYGQIEHNKELQQMETIALDAVERVRALHARVVIHPWAEHCPGQHLEPVDPNEATETGADPDQVEQRLVQHKHEDTDDGAVCLTCEPVAIACDHCTRDSDDTYTTWPCATLRALEPPKEPKKP